MVENFSIGFCEARQGLRTPTFAVDTLANVVGRETAERAVRQGKLFSTEESRSIGLVNEIAVSKDDAIERCTRWLKNLEVKPRRTTAKQSFDVENCLAFIKSPKVQEIIEKHVSNMVVTRRKIECN